MLPRFGLLADLAELGVRASACWLTWLSLACISSSNWPSSVVRNWASIQTRLRAADQVWNGKESAAWVVDYFDLKGKRRLKTFRTKHEAQDFAATTRIDIKRGLHIADGDSITVAEAGKLWLEAGKENGLVRSSLTQNHQRLHLHIQPFHASTRLSKLSVPIVRAFEGDLRANGRSPVLTRKVLSSLGAIIADAQERGLAMHNPVREMRQNRGKRRTKATRERKRPLAVGVDIPTPAEIKAILTAAAGFRRAFFATAALAGLRASELRGLR